MTAGAASSRELIERLRAGDVSALDVVLAGHWAPLVSYLTGVLGSSDAAQDIAQEAVWRLWQRRDQLRGDGSVRGFLYQVAHNLGVSERRRLRARARAIEVVRQEGPTATPPTELADEPLDAALERAIRELPRRRREILLLRSVNGLSYKEIAQTLGIAPQTVGNQLSAALATLRQVLAHMLA
jgi:RNA polymerase sigma-70 factor (ECF subfamily)